MSSVLRVPGAVSYLSVWSLALVPIMPFYGQALRALPLTVPGPSLSSILNFLPLPPLAQALSICMNVSYLLRDPLQTSEFLLYLKCKPCPVSIGPGSQNADLFSLYLFIHLFSYD